MIAKTSLFNKGIFKSTVKRNIWGAVLYFIILFLLSSMPLISQLDTPESYMHSADRVAIYRDGILFTAVLVGIIVPSIVAMLVYRFIHSKKAAVFIHSLPVNRTSVFISTLAAAFTLMALPVIANSIILMLLSVTGYSESYGISHCLVWAGINIMCQFVMFSIATFASVITGHTIASAVLTLIIHTAPIIAVSCLSYIAENFLWGYSANNSVINSVIEANPAMWIGAMATQFSYTGAEEAEQLFHLISHIPVYVISAAVLYALSGILYKKRGMETVEDVAAFDILNPVYKYFLTFIGSISVYCIFNRFITTSPMVFTAIMIILSAVIYFACEMILKKTLRVWNSYRGYLGFAVCFCAMLGIFAYTSFFGYETRIPDLSKIEKVAIYNYYYNEQAPYTDNAEIIKYATDTHREMSENASFITDDYYETVLHIEYNLKGGKTLKRAYNTSNEKVFDVLSELYSHDAYVRANEGVFTDKKLNKISFTKEGQDINITENASGLLECIQTDKLALAYGEQKINQYHFSLPLEIAFEIKENPETTEVAAIPSDNSVPSGVRLWFENVSVNMNYTNTLNWLRENGYESYIYPNLDENVYISKNVYTYDEEYTKEHTTTTEDMTIITDPNKIKVISDFIVNTKIHNDTKKEYIYSIGNVNKRIITQMTEKDINTLFELMQ